eukprot:gnl/TRDRNA2_/TRDRNA2_127126_c0_seq1.p1 gnl/TRDRNA2_/TRDRNA2_127126_c0~~gnl/TRDRNA2_/TRDRNA2_127126_c0_seq1.p1  ORF type:complete len:507 (+),score=61.53 gnl/TRDRNA2_/TRDRNA2_127126_c0_seq1:41-1522(+)
MADEDAQEIVDASEGVSVGRVGEGLWQSTLKELPRPPWAPREDFASMCAGKSKSGWRILWVLGGSASGGVTNDIWKSGDGGYTWEMMDCGNRWSPRARMGTTVGSTVAQPDRTKNQVQGLVYVVGGYCNSGLLGDVWASDTMCRSWHKMNDKAAFGARADVALAAVPGRPLELFVGGGVSVDAHRDLWMSCDGGETFAEVEISGLPRGPTFRLWPPDILCASRSETPGRLALWRLRLSPRDDAKKIWEVVGGSDKGGLLVRTEKALSSQQLSERISTGSLVKQLELDGERLHFEKITGTGPQSGWVSIKVKSKDLLVRTNKQLRAKDEDSAAEEVVPCAELEPLDPYADVFTEFDVHSVPSPPRLALDLYTQTCLTWDPRTACLVTQSLLSDDDGGIRGITRVRGVAAHAGNPHVLSDMDSVFQSLRHGHLWVLSSAGAWISDRGRWTAQDEFVKLLGLRLHDTYGMPIELWLGRVRPMLLPKPRGMSSVSLR